MSSKFSQFIEKNKIDPRRLLAASKRIERLRYEDRALKLKKRQSKGAAAAPAAEGEKAEPKKPRSGRPVTPRLVADAQAGKPVAGPAKTRILRAVNHLLSQKKQEKVELKTIF